MSKKLAIILDDGHGMETSGKRSPITGMKENEFNRPVMNYIIQICKAKGFLYKEVAPTDYDTPLSVRTNTANAWYADLVKQYGADNVVCVYISIHANAGGGTGVEVWIYHNPTAQTIKLGNSVLGELVKLKLKNRGLKRGFSCTHKNKPLCGCNFAVNRDTKMTSLLIEHAFMDTKADAALLLDNNFRKQCAIADVVGICKAYGFDYSGIEEALNPPEYHHIVVYNFKSKDDAELAKKKIDKLGYWNDIVVGKYGR